MSVKQPIDANEFMSTIQPALANLQDCGRQQELLKTLQEKWSAAQMETLLSDTRADVRKVAALALGLAAGKESIVPLAVALHDKDAMVNQMAEHALWMIWFRAGLPKACCLLKKGSECLGRHEFGGAIERFTESIEADPNFAEAYNQRAIAHYLAEDYKASIADCQAALKLMPQHFGAMAGMGHCYAHLCKLADARKCYRLALAINPRLEGIQDSLVHLDDLDCGPCSH